MRVPALSLCAAHGRDTLHGAAPPAACGPPGPLAPESVLFAAQIRRFCRPRDRTASPRAWRAPAPVLFAIAKSEALSPQRPHGFAPCGEVPQTLSCLLSQNRRLCRFRDRTASPRAGRPAEPVLFAAQSRGFCRLRRRCAKPSADPLLLCKARNFGLRHGFENPVVGVMERKFGTVGAIAFAFIFGFLPRPAVQIKEIQI